MRCETADWTLTGWLALWRQWGTGGRVPNKMEGEDPFYHDLKRALQERVAHKGSYGPLTPLQEVFVGKAFILFGFFVCLVVGWFGLV